MRKIKRKLPQFNIIIFVLSIFMGILGLFVLLSASSYLTIKNETSRYYYAVRQGGFLLFGCIAMFYISKIDYKYLRRFSFALYMIGIIFLLISLFGGSLRSPINGSYRAIKLGVSFMPSDFMKIAGILFISNRIIANRRNDESFIKGVVPFAILVLIPIFLVFRQPDLSTTLVMLMAFSSIYIVGGLKIKFLPYFLSGGALLGFVATKFLKGYQLERITSWLNPEAYYNGSSWQVLNGLFAVSRGGLVGVGYGKSVFKHGYLSDEVINDMIFSVISEEFGFLGAVIFILLISWFVYTILKESMRAKDEYAKLVLFGIGMLLFIQSFVNIGVAIGIIPNTGITLPFISYGGTSLVVFYGMMGIVLNITRFNNLSEKQK